MEMLEPLKEVLRKNAAFVSWYRKGRWIGGLLLGNLFNPGKIRLFLKLRPYTMVSQKRLSNVYELAHKVEAENVPGAFMEFGVWKGGAAACMAVVAKQADSERIVWLFDSFEGLPEPTEKDGEVAASFSLQRTSGKLQSIDKCVGQLEDVEKLFFSILKIPREHVRIAKGWFQNTVPVAKCELLQIAILRLDADWYESTKYVLQELYDRVAQGGYVIVDDYGDWEGCKRAVDEFFKERSLKEQFHSIDGRAIYFQK